MQQMDTFIYMPGLFAVPAEYILNSKTSFATMHASARTFRVDGTVQVLHISLDLNEQCLSLGYKTQKLF